LLKIQKKEGWDSRIVGQIHDSMIVDVNPAELMHVAKVIKKVTCKDLPRVWHWIIVPLDVEMGALPIDSVLDKAKNYGNFQKLELSSDSRKSNFHKILPGLYVLSGDEKSLKPRSFWVVLRQIKLSVCPLKV